MIRNACDYQPEAEGYSHATTRLQIPESVDLYRRRTDNLHYHEMIYVFWSVQYETVSLSCLEC